MIRNTHDADSKKGTGRFKSTPLRTIALHASAVETPTGVLLFMGHAGAGKSTIADLMAPRFPVLAQDAVFVSRRQDDGWAIAKADATAFKQPSILQMEPDRTAAVLDELAWTPLRSVLRIFQAPETRLVPVNSIATCRYLADAAFEVVWQQEEEQRVRRTFATVAHLARRYSGYELYFTLDVTTVDLIGAYFG